MIAFVSSIPTASSRCPFRRFPRPLGSPNSERVTFPTSSTSPKTKRMWDSSLPSTTTCPRPCFPKDAKSLKSGTRSKGTSTRCLISKKKLVAYCKSDVRLLNEGCLTFKHFFEAKAGSTRLNLSPAPRPVTTICT